MNQIWKNDKKPNSGPILAHLTQIFSPGRILLVAILVASLFQAIILCNLKEN